jgi:shikimate O-hydroxycinnamoyltransferase
MRDKQLDSQFLVTAKKHTPILIKCSVADRLLSNIPVPVVFFYKQEIPISKLVESLSQVLIDFPVFSGVIDNVNGDLYINCNNQGVLFSIAKNNKRLDDILNSFPTLKAKQLVDLVNPKKAKSKKTPIFTIKVTCFACGAMAIGACWHHSIGDMHTFMYLMKAWSDTINDLKYEKPIITEDRENYSESCLEDNHHDDPGIRYLEGKEIIRFMFYMMFRARNKREIKFYFSENELRNMCTAYSEKTGLQLTRNDSLCAHIFGIINEIDVFTPERSLSIAVEYRRRTNLPRELLGNYITCLRFNEMQNPVSNTLAKNIRESVNDFQNRFDYFSSKNYLVQHPHGKQLDRFIAKAIDPMKKVLLITNWASFGVYDVSFMGVKPFFFTPLGEFPFPWLTFISEGPENHGLVYSANLPKSLCDKLVQKGNVQRVHQYQDPSEILPESISKLKWLL